jgi:hypothetical protein
LSTRRNFAKPIDVEREADAGDLRTAVTREETLKGLSAPVRIATVPWS